MEQKEIEKILESLDGTQKVQPADFFYDRVMMKLENKEAMVIPMVKPVIWQVAAGLFLLVTLNIFVWTQIKPIENTSAQNSNPVVQEYFTYMNTVQF